MSRTSFLRPALLFLLACTTLAGATKTEAEEKRAAIRKSRDATLDELYRLQPHTRERIKKAAGYAVFSNIGVNLFFASLAGGSGVVVDSKGRETFMKMASAGVGIGLGVKDFRAVFIFHDPDKLESFIEKGWDFSGQADVAVKSDDKGDAVAAAMTAIPGVEIHQITKNGLALQATLQGTKYWRDRALD